MRNNQRRARSRAQKPTPKLTYEVPTEFVDLPSKGKFYTQDHPLHDAETIEIKFMTAKDEDILSSTSLIEQGVAIEKFLSNIIVDDIDPNTLLVGDQSAIMIAARSSAYGTYYETVMTCANCETKTDFVFNLEEKQVVGRCFDSQYMEDNNVGISLDGLITITLPVSKFNISLRMLTGTEQSDFSSDLVNNRDSMITSMLSGLIEKINDCEDRDQINSLIDNLPAKDSRYIRTVYPKLVPNIRLTKEFKCGNCGHEEEVEVPISAAFFWPE